MKLPAGRHGFSCKLPPPHTEVNGRSLLYDSIIQLGFFELAPAFRNWPGEIRRPKPLSDFGFRRAKPKVESPFGFCRPKNYPKMIFDLRIFGRGGGRGAAARDFPFSGHQPAKSEVRSSLRISGFAKRNPKREGCSEPAPEILHLNVCFRFLRFVQLSCPRHKL